CYGMGWIASVKLSTRRLRTVSGVGGQIVESTPPRRRRYYLARITDAGSVPCSTFRGQMAETVDFGPKQGTFVRTTKWNRTVLCPVPGRVHAIVARAMAVQALAPYLVVGVFWAPAADRQCCGFAPIPRACSEKRTQPTKARCGTCFLARYSG